MCACIIYIYIIHVTKAQESRIERTDVTNSRVDSVATCGGDPSQYLIRDGEGGRQFNMLHTLTKRENTSNVSPEANKIRRRLQRRRVRITNDNI